MVVSSLLKIMEDFVLVFFILGLTLPLFFLGKFSKLSTISNSLHIFVVNALLAISGVFLVLFLSECYFRFIDDSSNSYALSKGAQKWLQTHYAFNNFGFRDSTDYTLTKVSGKRRISFLGDSFTAGHGIKNVEERFTNLLRAKHPEVDIQVFASNGHDTGMEMNVLESLFKQGLETDAVILIYCLNDISDLSEAWHKSLSALYRKQQDSSFANASYLFSFLHFKWLKRTNADAANYYALTLKQYESSDWDRQKKRLTQLNEIVQKNNAVLKVVTLPYVHLLGGVYPYQEVHKKLESFWRELKVPYLDLTADLQAHGALQLFVSSDDAHPNETAHSIIFKSLDDFIVK